LLRAVLRLRLPAVKRYETSLYSKATRLWFSNLDDIQLASSKGDLVPNIPFTLPARQTLVHSSESSKIILWVGSFNHRVNLEGVELFLRHTWPAILGTCLGARFRIVGSGLADGVRRRWESISGVDVVGYAESLAPHYADAALSIVPLMDGAGTKIKVLESLGYMRTCVVTKHSIAGFESLLRNGESVRTVSSLEGLPAVVEELLSQPKLRHQMEERGRAIIDSHFTSFAVQDAVRQSLECLGGQLLSV
jgi:glycosyltransferase involved in cell wall biosynthesis